MDWQRQGMGMTRVEGIGSEKISENQEFKEAG